MVRRARGGHVVDPVREALSRNASGPIGASAPYPSVSVETLGLLGTIDALLKAPPAPARSALLHVLAILEESREAELAVEQVHHAERRPANQSAAAAWITASGAGSSRHF